MFIPVLMDISQYRSYQLTHQLTESCVAMLKHVLNVTCEWSVLIYCHHHNNSRLLPAGLLSLSSQVMIYVHYCSIVFIITTTLDWWASISAALCAGKRLKAQWVHPIAASLTQLLRFQNICFVYLLFSTLLVVIWFCLHVQGVIHVELTPMAYHAWLNNKCVTIRLT